MTVRVVTIQEVTLLKHFDIIDIDEDEELISDGNLPKDSCLVQYFNSIHERLSKEYSRGTFWIEPMSPFFAMKKSSNVVSLYQPRVFLSVPHLLTPNGLQDLKCFTCDSKSETKGYNKDPYARRVVDLYK